MSPAPAVPAPAATSVPRRVDLAVFWFTLALTAWAYLSGARLHTGHLTSREPAGYYGLLTEALLDGQLHLKLTPDPRLLLLANPYAGPQGTSRPHDMSFYRGRFYLYYGVTPVLLLFGPWKLATGTYLTEACGTALLCLGAFALGAWWLLGLKRRLFPRVSAAWLLLALSVVAFGSPVFFLAGQPTFYVVPIAGACLCLMAVLCAADFAVRAEKTSRRLAWLALASLWAGLAVGARPIYVLGLPALALPAWIVWRGARGSFAWVAVATVAPAALVGAALAAYNYARFGSVLDFGIQYSLATGDLRGAHLVGSEFIGKNLWLYLFESADWIRYWPFLITNDRPFGVFPHFPLAVVALLLWPLTLLRPALRRDAAWLAGGGWLVLASAANLALLCLFFGGEDRYLADFAPGLLLAAAAMLLAVADSARRTARLALAAVAVFTLGNGLIFALSHRAQPASRQWLARALDWPAHLAEQIAGVRHGALELDVRFAAAPPGTIEPLLTTGVLRGVGDIFYLRHLAGGRAQLGYFHVGAGGPESEPFALSLQKNYHLTFRAGALLPPPEHPLFAAMTPAHAGRARRQLEIFLDGTVVLRAAVSAYPSTPGCTFVGENPLPHSQSAAHFTGKILSAQRASWLGVPRSVGAGPARLRVRLPEGDTGIGQPLVSTGPAGGGDVVFLEKLPGHRVRFGHDSQGGGRIFTRDVAADPAHAHLIEIEMGSLYPPDGTAWEAGLSRERIAALRQRFSVRFDGELIIATTRPFRPSAADEVEFGLNTAHLSGAEAMFTGTIATVERPGVPPPAIVGDTWGPLRLTLRWPAGLIGTAEPLLVTGKIGAADIVYVRYVDARHVQIGLDHWSLGGPLSEPLEIDPAADQIVEIFLDSLLPPAGHRAAHAGAPPRAEVRLNGRTVLSGFKPAWPATPDEVAVGENYLGASTCGQSFSGKILRSERLPW